MKGEKQFSIKNKIGWIIFIIALLILVLMYRNDMNFELVVQKLLGFIGK